jgi:hypothetical protein
MRSPVSWPDFQNSGTGSPTEYSTHSMPEFHSAAVACSLSDILETGDVPRRFYLSATACRGILRRAEKRGKTLPTIPSRSSAGGGLGTDFDCDGDLVPSTGDVSHCLNAGGMGRQDYETETLIAHSLRAEGFDASEDGTGRGTPLVPVASELVAREHCARTPDCAPRAAMTGIAYTFRIRAEVQAVCFTAKDHGADASDISPTLRSGSHSGSHANGGVMPAVAFADCFNASGGDVDATMGTRHQQRQRANASFSGSAVRRLTPRECERLQGFPDDYTAVPYRGKTCCRWAALQGARQFDGGARDALDRRADCDGRSAYR